jgi:sec-independent protein translocase protein TatA
MGLDNPIHIAFLLILLLLVFGAKRLPEMGRSLGDGMRGFKDAIAGEGTQTPTQAVAQPALFSQHQAAPSPAPVEATAAVQAVPAPVQVAAPAQAPPVQATPIVQAPPVPVQAAQVAVQAPPAPVQAPAPVQVVPDPVQAAPTYQPVMEKLPA